MASFQARSSLAHCHQYFHPFLATRPAISGAPGNAQLRTLLLYTSKYMLTSANVNMKLHAHCGYIMPVLTFGATLWSGNLADVKKLETVQHKITHWILSTSHHSYKKRLILLNILPVSLYNEMHTLLLLAGILEGKFDVQWRDFVQLVESSSRQSSKKTFEIPMKTKKAGMNNFWYRAPLLCWKP